VHNILISDNKPELTGSTDQMVTECHMGHESGFVTFGIPQHHNVGVLNHQV